MPYQDRHPVDSASDPSLAIPGGRQPAGAGNNGRSIQILLVIGLIAAILVAVFGHY